MNKRPITGRRVQLLWALLHAWAHGEALGQANFPLTNTRDGPKPRRKGLLSVNLFLKSTIINTMDPLSAIGLASNILQFIEFGANICRGVYEIANSATGQTTENAHVSVWVEDLKQAVHGLSVNTHGTSAHERELAKLAGQCRDVSVELTDILSKLKAKKGDRLWSSIRISLRSSFKRRDIAALRTRLEDYRAQILLRLSLLLSEEQSPVKGYLKQIQQQAIDLGNQHGTQIQTQSDHLQEIIQKLSVVQSSTSDIEAIRIATADIQSSLRALQQSASQIPRENETLRALYFPSMFHRDDAIQSAAGGTYRWLVGDDGSSNRSDGRRSSDGSPGNLPTWLLTDEASRRAVANRFQNFLHHGNGVFVIFGKAGSGKSTLMRFVADANNLAVRARVHSWAAGRRLILISVYFWGAGDILQRSLEGLYRSVLYQALRQCPELIPEVFEHGPDQATWERIRLPVLKRAMNKLMQSLDLQLYSLCLIIDGLDEYEGDSLDHTALVKDIRSWGRENVKIVCSTRPHPEYVHTFTEQERTLQLHALTKADIWEYTMSMFSSHAGPQTDPSNLLFLADRVVDNAEGVFLWAYLVVRSLTRKMRLFSVDQLTDMLSATPRDLNRLFDQMLSKVDPLAQKHTENFLLLVLRNPFRRRLNALSFSWIEDLASPTFPFQRAMCSYTRTEIEQRLDLVQSQIGDLTGGMLEIRKSQDASRNFFFRHIVDFFHRTFRDYLMERWHDRQGPTAETYMRIALAELKFSYSMDMYNSEVSTQGSFIGFVWVWNVIMDSFKASRPGVGEVLARSTIFLEELELLMDGYGKLLDSSGERDSGDKLSNRPVFEPDLLDPVGRRRWRSSFLYNKEAKELLGLRPFSFLNFVAAQHNIPNSSDYFVKRLTECVKLNPQRSHVSLVEILIHSTLRPGQEAVSSFCLGNGVLWSSPVSVWLTADEGKQQCYPEIAPAWLVLLGMLVYNELILQFDPNLLGHKLEQLLQAGVYLFSVVFVISLKQSSNFSDADSRRVIDIRELVEIVQPENVDFFRELLNDRAPRELDTWRKGIPGTEVSTMSSPQDENGQELDYAEEIRTKYRKPSPAEIHELQASARMPRVPYVVDMVTRTQRLPREFLIQGC
ncbi:hypothetical protein BJY01DRAFT_253789 [Aspergillus pseudoustus]|uniref:NACHT domain-containing protein n=1 Tax=Aspergillus pseudoustus TaxID=1810923 RepID=A0ABR4IY34_9EURO